MPITDTAELLFKIGADSSDAQSNVQRFRTVLSKDLGDIEREFSDWGKKVFGSLATPAGIMTAAAATVVAGTAAIAAAAKAAQDRYVDFVSEVGRGAKTMQISIEDASALHYAAQKTGTDYDLLSKGVAFFEVQVAKANQGSQAQVDVFKRLGVSRQQLAAGEQNMVPLLGTVMDKWRNLASGVDRVTIARELFSRGGLELQSILKLGSGGLEEMRHEAEKLGLVLSQEDVLRVRTFKLAQKEIKEQREAMELEVGRATINLTTKWKVFEAALFQVLSGKGAGGYGLFGNISNTMDQIMANIQKNVKALGALGDEQNKFGDGTKEAKENWYGISSLLEGVDTKLANLAGKEEANVQEIAHLKFEVQKATEEYQKLTAEGKLTGESAAREAEKLRLLPARIQQLQNALAQKLREEQTDAIAQSDAKLRELMEQQGTASIEVSIRQWNAQMDVLEAEYAKKKDKVQGWEDRIAEIRAAGLDKINRDQAREMDAATEDLEHRLEAQAERTFAIERSAWNREIDELRERYDKEGKLTAANEELIARLRSVGMSRIQREETQALQTELQALQQQLAGLVGARMVANDRLKLQYDLDVQALGQAETEKVKLFAAGSAEQLAILTMFGLVRQELAQKYQADLNALQNSQGWRGVFGSGFEQLLSHDEAALKRWRESSRQSHQMVAQSMTALAGLGREAFGSLAQGMGQNIAQAIVYSQSIGQAMRAALAATLESIAARALTEAIYATALGFLCLAEGDFAGAGNAFTSAAIFAAVGGAAALAGRAVAPKQATAASASAAGGGAGASSGAANDSTGSQANPAPTINIVVEGHLVNADGLIDILNEAVTERDKTLYATATTTGKVVRR